MHWWYFDAYSTHVELKISGCKQDIQQLFNVMDDGRKGYVSGADLMTLQAVDAANLSENDLQVGQVFQVIDEGKCPQFWRGETK